MTQAKRRIAISTLLALFAVMVALFAINFNFSKTYALSTNTLISDYENAIITYEAEGPSVDQGRKGIKVTTAEAGKKTSFTFADIKGAFNLVYRAYGEGCDLGLKNHNPDGIVIIAFQNKVLPAESFELRLEDRDNGTAGSIYHVVWYKGIKNEQPLYHYAPGVTAGGTGKLNYLTSKTTSFRQDSLGYTQGVSFDPYTMELYYLSGNTKTKLVDFDDVEDMKANFAGSQIIEDMSCYDVTISIRPDAGQVANVMLYQLNGENLGVSDIADVAGPSFAGKVNNPTGVIGYDYKIDTTNYKMYDLVEGLTAFNGSIKVKTPNGVVKTVQNNVFVPDVKGTHYLRFIPQDSKGNNGSTFEIPFEVIPDYPISNIELGYGIVPELVANDSAMLPGATFTSTLAGRYDGAIIVSAKVYAEGTLVKTVEDASSPFKVDFGGKSNISVVYSATDYLGRVFETEEYVLNNNNVSIAATQVKSTVVVGDYIVADKADGCTQEIIAPSGNVYSFEKVKADEVGTWTVNYYYEGGVYTQYVEAVETIQSLWNTKLGLVIKDEIETVPEYNRVIKEGAVMNSATPYSGAEFKNIINVADYTDEDVILEWFTVPKVNGTNEFKQLNFHFDDLVDPSRSVKVEFYLPPYYEWNNVAIRVYLGGVMVKENVYLRHTSFYGEWTKTSPGASQYNNSPVQIGFNYVEKYFYMRNDHEQNQVSLIDPAIVGIGKEWKGFTNDEMKFSLEYAAITGETNLYVRMVDNLSLTKKIVTDNVAPQVSVNYDPSNVAKAKVGTRFPIMSAYAMDAVDGRINNVKATVSYLQNGRLYDYPISADGSFTPDKAGDYVIAYTAKDLSGNEGSRTITVTAYNTLPELDIDIKDQLASLYPEQIRLGEKFVIHPANGVGGSGEVDVDIVIRDGNQDVTDSVVVDDVYVVPTKASSDLKVVYILKDYLGQVKEVPVAVNVARSDAPIFSKVIVPGTVLKDKVFNIPTRTAVYYDASGVKTELDVTVKLNGQAYSNATYTPTAVGSFTLQYVTNMGESEIYTINVVTPATDADGFYTQGYLASFFHLTGDISINAAPTGDEAGTLDWMIFNVNSDSKLMFVTPQSAIKSTVQFTLDNASNFIGKINFKWTNVDNPDETIVLTVQKDPNPAQTAGLVTVNGRETYSFPGNVTVKSPKGLSVGFDIDKVMALNNTVITTLDKTLDGAAFNGFTSDKVYLEIEFVDVTAPSEFRLMSLNGGQKFAMAYDGDFFAPILIMDAEIVLGQINEEYVLPNMKVEDILDTDVTAKMVVTTPTGRQIHNGDVEEFKSFTPTEYGTYRIKITCSDSSGQTATISENVKILNTKNETISIQGTAPESVKKGSMVQVPALLDVPADATVFVYALSPAGTRIVIKDSRSGVNKTEFKADEYGNYRLFYTVISSSGVVNVKSFTIKAK